MADKDHHPPMEPPLETQEHTTKTTFEIHRTRRVFGSGGKTILANNKQNESTTVSSNVDDLLQLVSTIQPRKQKSLWDDPNASDSNDEEEEEELELTNSHNTSNEEIPSDTQASDHASSSSLLLNHQKDATPPPRNEEEEQESDDDDDDTEQSPHTTTTLLTNVFANLPPPKHNLKAAANTNDTVVADHSSASDQEESDAETTVDEPTESSGIDPSTKDDDEPAAAQANKPTKRDKPPQELDLEAILHSTELLFSQVSDAQKSSVTVKDITKSLSAEYNTKKLPKHIRAAVRDRLTQLMTEQHDDEPDDNEEEYADDEQDDEDYQDQPRQLRRPKKTKSTTLALRVHAEQRRKRRLQELRVIAEEMQSFKTNKDAERASDIAKKFELDSSVNIPHRLKLLEQLDTKRLSCVQRSIELPSEKQEEEKASQVPLESSPVKVEDESSEDDMELEIIRGGDKKLFDPQSSSALDILNRSVKKKKGPVALTNPRVALMEQLRHKQRTFGNLWLAKELGYKSSQEHVEACLKEEMKKKLEIERLEAAKVQQRNQIRERLLKGEHVLVEDEQHDEAELDESNNTPMEDDEEEDEEMALAKSLFEAENDKLSAESEVPADKLQPPESTPTMDSATNEAPSDSIDNMASPGAKEDTSPSNVPFETQLPGNALLPTAATREPAKDQELSATAESQPESVPTNDVPVNDDDSVSDEAIETQLPSDLLPKTNDTLDDSADPKEASVDSSNGTVVSNDEEAQSEDGDVDQPNSDNVTEENPPKPKGPRNAAWKAMLEKDAAVARRKKKSSLVEEEADEEEEEEVAGLEDFGFTVQKKKKDDEEGEPGEFDQDDLDNVVDDLSDGEGDEDAGNKARTAMQQKEEKERHKEILRRMRDGYDGRRGGIAGGGAGARGVHRFDELVAADNREDAKRLGLLNDDELDSEDEEMKDDTGNDEEEDEVALLDKMLKDRFLHRSSVEENFSEDEEDAEETGDDSGAKAATKEEEELREQERLEKRFAKRARMQRLIEKHGHEEEFSQSRLIDEDTSLRIELQQMKDGLSRKSSQSSEMSAPNSKSTLTTSLFHQGGSLALALQASRRANKQRTSFVRRGSMHSTASSEASSSYQKSIAFNHVVFQTSESKSQFSKSGSTGSNLPPRPNKRSSGSLFSKSILSGFSKKQRKV